MPLLGAKCWYWVLVLGASTGCKVIVLGCMLLVLVACSRSQRWVPILGASAGCPQWVLVQVPVLGAHYWCWVHLVDAGAGCPYRVPVQGAGAGCPYQVPVRVLGAHTVCRCEALGVCPCVCVLT